MEEDKNDGRFKKGHTLSAGRKKGSKNKITKDVRACFADVYERMAEGLIDGKTGLPLTGGGNAAMLVWARENPTQFYVLFSKMIDTKVVLDDDSVENWLDGQIFEEHHGKLVDANAVDVTDVGNEGPKQLQSGEDNTDNDPPDSDTPTDDPHLV